jgi:hypothetical protein
MSVRQELKGFLALTPTSPKSPTPLSNEVFTPAREHRDSTSSESSVGDVGENGFLVLTPAERAAVIEVGLGKIIEEEAVE